MFSLTQVSLASYLLRIIKDIVSRHPRFRNSLGNVSMQSSNSILFNNVQVLIRDITTDATRLSPDYFIATTIGRAILTQVGDKDGVFIEWIAETDKTHNTPIPGIYYLNVDGVNEANQAVQFTMQTYKWYEGFVKNAQGTKIGFRPGIDATTLTVIDPTTGLGPDVQPGLSYIYLLQNVGGLEIKDQAGYTLTPNIDYWMEVTQTTVLVQSTVFGVQLVTLPAGYSNISLTDQDGYVLIPGKDYTQPSPGVVQLSAWTPAAQTIYITGTVQLDPTVLANLTNAENLIPITLLPGETLVADQVFISTQEADHIQATVNNGVITLPTPLTPGGWLKYEVRVLVGSAQVLAQKNAVNKAIIPGLRLAIGDRVVEGDQCAIVVSPKDTATYRVYGSKPGVNVTLDVKANDPTTADEIAKMILQQLLVSRRETIENDGLTIFEASTSFAAASRDDSGTAPSYTVSVAMTAAADWRVFEPLVTRVTGFNITAEPFNLFSGKLLNSSRYQCLTSSGFIPGYG